MTIKRELGRRSTTLDGLGLVEIALYFEDNSTDDHDSEDERVTIAIEQEGSTVGYRKLAAGRAMEAFDHPMLFIS